uniref:Uncharacterized protein n=1 Tax=Anguilla anguilla TaxID=7936 RepID=A0A0E9QI34_ANGAN
MKPKKGGTTACSVTQTHSVQTYLHVFVKEGNIF